VADGSIAICREALTNSVRHAEASVIECNVRFSQQEFRLLCRDNGKGIPADILRAGGRDGHWGL
jgi:signal transduction histidine kinase